MDDEALLAGCRRREPQALEALVVRYAGPVRAVIRGVIKDPHEVEDAFQETFLSLADPRLFLRMRGASALRGTVLTIARRRATDRLRKRYRDLHGRQALSREIDSEPSHEPAAMRFPAFDEILGLLPDSSAGERSALLLRLRYRDSLSYDEIATRTGIPRGSIGPTIAGALAKLAAPVRIRIDDPVPQK